MTAIATATSATGAALRRGLGGRRPRLLAACLSMLTGALVLRHVLGAGGGITQSLARLSWHAAGWLVLAAACELLSYLAYANGQRAILGGAGYRFRRRWLASLTVSAQALSNFIPLGYLAGNGLVFRELRARGVPTRQAAGSLAAVSALYVGVLVAVAFVAAEATGGPARWAVDVRLAATSALALAAIGALGLAWLRRAAVARSWAVAGALRPLGLRASRVLRAAGWFLCSWVLDAGCLIGACLAVGWTPPWSAFPVAYAAAQLASLLPITPGGLGIVEGGLAMMLAAGGPSGQILGAVLVYRLLAYWATLPGGVLAYLAVRAGRERAGGPAERGDGTLFQTAAPAAA